jgi:hypothetical protein
MNVYQVSLHELAHYVLHKFLPFAADNYICVGKYFLFYMVTPKVGHIFECYIAKPVVKIGHQKKMLQVSLKPLKTHGLGGIFVPLLTFYMLECSSGVITPNFSEMKGKRY